MRPLLRKAGLAIALGSLVFWFSCERHKVGELGGEHHSETKAPAHEHSSTAEHTSPTPDPRNSPANFFPDKPKP